MQWRFDARMSAWDGWPLGTSVRGRKDSHVSVGRMLISLLRFTDSLTISVYVSVLTESTIYLCLCMHVRGM